MAIIEIPLSPENQKFSIALYGKSLQISLIWRATFWCLDIMDGAGNPLINGIPLVSGVNLLEQYNHLGLGFALYLSCDDPLNDYPTETDLGIKSHLYAVTE